MWRAVTGSLLGCVPDHGSYLTVYKSLKQTFSIFPNNQLHPTFTLLTGSLATMAQDLFMTLIGVVKQRIQFTHACSPVTILPKF